MINAALQEAANPVQLDEGAAAQNPLQLRAYFLPRNAVQNDGFLGFGYCCWSHLSSSTQTSGNPLHENFQEGTGESKAAKLGL